MINTSFPPNAPEHYDLIQIPFYHSFYAFTNVEESIQTSSKLLIEPTWKTFAIAPGKCTCLPIVSYLCHNYCMFLKVNSPLQSKVSCIFQLHFLKSGDFGFRLLGVL